MAVIDRNVLLADIKIWLPSENILTDAQILVIEEGVISDVGDDDVYYDEILCKGLKACAEMNKALSGISAGAVKREKSHGREVEWFESTNASKLWNDYIASLATLCPLLPNGGYTPNSSVTSVVYMNVADDITFPKFCD